MVSAFISVPAQEFVNNKKSLRWKRKNRLGTYYTCVWVVWEYSIKELNVYGGANASSFNFKRVWWTDMLMLKWDHFVLFTWIPVWACTVAFDSCSPTKTERKKHCPNLCISTLYMLENRTWGYEYSWTRPMFKQIEEDQLSRESVNDHKRPGVLFVLLFVGHVAAKEELHCFWGLQFQGVSYNINCTLILMQNLKEFELF